MSLKSHWVVVAGWLAVVTLGCLEPAAAGEKVWHSFCGAGTGCNSQKGAGAQGLIPDSSGNLYGVAGAEGTYAAGVIFKWGPTSGGQYTALYNFCPGNLLIPPTPCTDGDGPQGKLIIDSGGNLHGATRTAVPRLQRITPAMAKSTNFG